MDFSLAWVPVAYLLILSIPLAITDFREHRLPNPLTVSAIAVTVTCLTFESFRYGEFRNLIWGIGFGLITLTLGFLLAKREMIGMGDVKLLTSMHAVAGYINPMLPILTLTAGLVIATAVSLLRVFLRKIDLKSSVPLGPYLLLGFFPLVIPSAVGFTAGA